MSNVMGSESGTGLEIINLGAQAQELEASHNGPTVAEDVVTGSRRTLSLAARAGIAGVALSMLTPNLAAAAETSPPEELTITNSCDDVARTVEVTTKNNTDRYIYAVRYDLFGNGSTPESSKEEVIIDGETIKKPVYPFDVAPFPTHGKRVEATVIEAADRNTGTISSHRPPKVSTVIDRSNCSGGKVPVTPEGVPLNKPIVGIAQTSTGNGYNLVASDGGVFAFGDAQFKGSLGGIALDKPIVGMAQTSTGNGYNLVASDGGVFSFGDAEFQGSQGGTGLAKNKEVVGIADTPTDEGYWQVAVDGTVTPFGDAEFMGSADDSTTRKGPAVGIAAVPDGKGYVIAASGGSVNTFGSAPFKGSLVVPAPILGTPPTQP